MRNEYLIDKKGKRKKEKPKITTVFIVLVIIFAVIVGSFVKYALDKKIEVCNQKIAVLEQQIKDEDERAKEIVEYGKYTKTKKFVEEIAKEKLGLVNENEIVFKTEN